jgi:hypothetical protein
MESRGWGRQGKWDRSTGAVDSGTVKNQAKRRNGEGGRLGEVRESEVVGAVGDSLVAERFANCGALDKKYARHALDFAGWKADKMAVKEGADGAADAFRVEQLAELRSRQAEGLVQTRMGIAETWNIGQIIRSEKPLGLFLGSEMNKGERDILDFDAVALLRYFGDRFAAEITAEMPQEDEKDAILVAKFGERAAMLGAVGGEQSRIELS